MAKPVVIAHRGASGYLPEHTLAAKAVAHAMGADFIEQDIVLTSDGIPVVLHDIQLDRTTDVAQRFPSRARKDGRFYAMDFSLAEVKTLAVHERRLQNDPPLAAYPERFPTTHALFTVPTLEEEIDLIEGLNKSMGREAGLYIEFKSPRLHADRGLDIAEAVVKVLERKGWANDRAKVYLQCFDDQTLRALSADRRTPLPLVQLIGDNSWGEDSAVDYNHLRTEEGLDDIAEYAQGIGPWINHLYQGRDDQGSPLLSTLVASAQQRGLVVHPFTFRRDALPPGIRDFNELLSLFVEKLQVDGLFTDFPDLAVEFLAAR